jgi:two-component system, chemotaxis family, CheB/CheR fusion protein
MDRRIRRYTSAAEKLFNLVPADIGRSIDHIDRFLGSAQAATKVKTVLDTLATVEDEILCSNQRWYLLRICPYRTADHVIRGAVLTLSDIDIQKRAHELSRNVGDYATRFLGAIGHPLTILDSRFRMIWSNERFLDSFQLTSEETIGSVFVPADGRDAASVTLRQRLGAALASGEPLLNMVIDRVPGASRIGPMRLGASRLPLVDSNLLLVSLEDDASLRPEPS